MERVFIEPNVMGNINVFHVGIETLISMMVGAIAKENTRSGSKIHLVVVIGAKVRVTLLAKDAKKEEI